MSYDKNDTAVMWTLGHLPNIRENDLTFVSDEPIYFKRGIYCIQSGLEKILENNIIGFTVKAIDGAVSDEYEGTGYRVQLIFNCKEDADLYLILVSC